MSRGAARGREILTVAARHALHAAAETRLGLRSREHRQAIVARRVRRALEDLGPGFIKLGQLLSVRPDLVPLAWTTELQQLQRQAPPVPTEHLRAIVRTELGAPPDAIFDAFEAEPRASASVAQVHRARLRAPYRPVIGDPLPAGTAVAVKVLRPGIDARLADDIAWARRWATRLERLPGVARLGASAFLDEAEASLERELDLREEGRVADRFARDFAADPIVVVPRVVWTHSTRRVLVTEWLDGWHLSELGPAERAGIDARHLAEHGARAFLRQVLVLGRFHADLHSANLLITRDGRIGYLDFGIVGTADATRRRGLARLLAATAYGEPDLALRASRELGLDIPPDREEAVVREVEVLAARHLRHRSPADVRGYATGFLALLRRHRIAVPRGYGLLVKALLTVEGVARGLYPDLDVVEVARPEVTRLLLSDVLATATLPERASRALRAGVRAWIA